MVFCSLLWRFEVRLSVVFTTFGKSSTNGGGGEREGSGRVRGGRIDAVHVTRRVETSRHSRSSFSSSSSSSSPSLSAFLAVSVSAVG